MLLSSQHQCPCLFMGSKCGCMVSSLFSPQHPPLPTPALREHTISSREAQVFAPLMCSKKRQLSHAQQEIPRAGALSLAPSSLAFIYKWAACTVCSEGFFSPCAEDLLTAAGLFYWHEMTDVTSPLCARQLNKLPQQQHVPTVLTVLMEGPPVLGGRSSVTLAHTAILKESVPLPGSDRLPTPRHDVVEGISGMREGGRITWGEKYDNGELN